MASFFDMVIVLKKMRKNQKDHTLALVKADTFYQMLKEIGVREGVDRNVSMHEMLQLSLNFPEFYSPKTPKPQNPNLDSAYNLI